MYSENMQFDHLYQSLVADNNPALPLVERAEEEGRQQCMDDLAKQVGLSDSWDFDRWVERRQEESDKAQSVYDSEKYHDWFSCLKGDDDTRSTQLILSRLDCLDAREVAEFLLEAIKIIRNVRM